VAKLSSRERRIRRKARTAREEAAHAIASRVYSVALDVGEDATYPLVLQAPVQTAAEIAAARIVEERWPGEDEARKEELLAGVVTYLLAGFFALALEYDPVHHARFRAATEGDGDGDGSEGAALGGARSGERGPAREGGAQGEDPGG
jgi:hypothetical protein